MDYNQKPSENNEAKARYCAERSKCYEELQKTGAYQRFNDIVDSSSMCKMPCEEYHAIEDAYNCFIAKKELPPVDDNMHSGTGEKWTDMTGYKYILPRHPDHRELIDKARIVFEERNYAMPCEQVIVVRTDSNEKNLEVFLGAMKEHSAEVQKDMSPEIVHDRADSKGADAIVAAEAEAERILEHARAEAEKIVSAADEKANAIVSCAQAKQDELIAAGEDRKQALIREGEAERQQLLESVTQEQYREKLEQRIKDNFRKEHADEQSMRIMLDNEYSSLVKEKNDMLDGINNGVQTLHSSFMLSIDVMLDKMRDMQSEMHEQLNTWRRDLYQSELQGLGTGLMNLDKIIVSLENKIAVHLSYIDNGEHAEIADDLGHAVRNLKTFKDNLEKSLARNSIRLLIPKVGDIFDSNYHRAENIDPMNESHDSFDGNRITAVSDAGIVRSFNSGDTVLKPAIVTVEK